MSIESKAVGMYAVAARDAGDFIDMLGEECNPEVIKLLYLMLVTPNPKQSREDRKLNAIMGPIVGRRLDKLGIPRPEIPSDV